MGIETLVHECFLSVFTTTAESAEADYGSFIYGDIACR